MPIETIVLEAQPLSDTWGLGYYELELDVPATAVWMDYSEPWIVMTYVDCTPDGWVFPAEAYAR